MADTDRGYVSQYSQQDMGISIVVAGVPTDPDNDAVNVTVLNTDTQALLFTNRVAVQVGTGDYQITLTPDDTAVLGNYQATWTYLLNGVQQTFLSWYGVGGAEPAYDTLTQDLQAIVDSVWVRMADMFDSPSGGPNLQSWVQANFNRGRIAQLMKIAVGRLNTEAQPYSSYSTTDPSAPFPTAQWGPLLEQACVVPSTLVLRKDLLWVPAGELRSGEQIIAFDEESRDSRFRTATVQENEPFMRSCSTVETSVGSVTATNDHPWLVRVPTGVFQGKQFYRRAWVRTSDLVPLHHEILSIGEPWVENRSYEAGYLAGMFDGEGCLTFSSPDRVRKTVQDNANPRLIFTQKEGMVLDLVVESLKAFGYKISGQTPNRKQVSHIYVGGGFLGVMRFLGEMRPQRLLMESRLSELWEGRALRNTRLEGGIVLSVTPAGEQVVAGIQTDTATLITNGLLSHNTWVETVKHLRRSYLEQPDLAGGSISRLDRTRYYDRWTDIYADEQALLKQQLDIFKISQMGLGKPSILVSGGAFGRYSSINRPYMAARPRLWFANVF